MKDSTIRRRRNDDRSLYLSAGMVEEIIGTIIPGGGPNVTNRTPGLKIHQLHSTPRHDRVDQVMIHTNHEWIKWIRK